MIASIDFSLVVDQPKISGLREAGKVQLKKGRFGMELGRRTQQ